MYYHSPKKKFSCILARVKKLEFPKTKGEKKNPLFWFLKGAPIEKRRQFFFKGGKKKLKKIRGQRGGLNKKRFLL